TSTVVLEGGLADIEVDLGQDTISYDGQPMLSTDELKQIQQDILETIWPTWQSIPLKNFGSPAHGKLKADQWRTCIEFDLPVSLMKMWEETSQAKLHANEYRKHMMAYLKMLRELCPNMDLHPVHHNALHIPEFLLRFGPMHGWWMFLFERLIGILQKIKINFKISQLERTMMQTFCAASELRVFLQWPGCPEVLRECAPILADCFPLTQKGTLNHDMATLEEDGENKLSRPKNVRLEDDIHNALVRLVPGHPRTVHKFARLEIGELFTLPHLFLPDSGRNPGIQ
ncbi:hypothetical protein K443DRAFT_118066, partial [Laccaria amethystina LaAM-08-1]